MSAPRIKGASFVGAFICGFAVTLFCLILLWRDPLVFWNDDYQISISPVFADVARSWRGGEWPILSPYSWACGNLAGEYQYGTFSLFVNAAVVAVWKTFSSFAPQAAALSIVHLIVLATGGFMLGRGRALSLELSMMVGLIAALNGWMICWGASDWFGALAAFAWVPWAWWACEKALEANNVALAPPERRSVTEGDRQWSTRNPRHHADATAFPWRFLWPAPFVYLVATGGFPYTVLMFGLLVVWLTAKSLVQLRSVRAVLPMLLGVALGFAMAAPALLALLSYVHGSAREAQPASAHWQWIVPPAALPGLILPSWTVKWADFSTRYVTHRGAELACGLVAPAAVLSAVLFRARLTFTRLRWELVLLLVVLTISMLPTAGLFRWSFRWLPLLHLILGLCAAEYLGWSGTDERREFSPALPAIVAVVLLCLTAIAAKLFSAAGTYFLPLIAILIGIAGVWVGAEYVLINRPKLRGWLPAGITFATLLATYICVPPNCGVPRFNFTESLVSPVPLDPSRLYLSIYPAPEINYRTEVHPQRLGNTVRPGSSSMWGRLHFLNGYSPIRPAGVAKEFFFSIHGEIDPGVARLLLMKEAGAGGLLEQLGVDGITIAREMEFNPEPGSDWQLIGSTDEGRIFHRRGWPLPRVRSPETIPSRPGQTFATAKISEISQTRNRVEADVEVAEGSTPALITFSRPYFEGYTASLGDRPMPVSSDRGFFPVVELPPGSRGRLVLSYRPNWLVYGGAVAVVCGAGWLLCATAAVFQKRSGGIGQIRRIGRIRNS